MNANVNKLLDADKEARRLLDEAQQYHEQTLVEIQEEKKKILTAYTEKADSHVRQLHEELSGEVEEAVEAVRKRTASAIASLDQRYDQLHQQWEDQLVQNCVGR